MSQSRRVPLDGVSSSDPPAKQSRTFEPNHIEVRPKCDRCGQFFKSRQALRSHKRSRHQCGSRHLEVKACMNTTLPAQPQVGAIRIPELAVPWLNSPCKRNTGGETVIVCGPPGSATLSDSDDDLASLPYAPLLEPPPLTDLNNNFGETVIVCGPPGSVTLSIYHPFQVLPCWSLPIRRIPTITLDISSGPPA